MTTGRSGSYCLVPSADGRRCTKPVVGNHSVQRAILDRMDHGGHVKAFPRSIREVSALLITENENTTDEFHDQGRWLPEDYGIDEASVGEFACNADDSSFFRSIERNESNPTTHPLDSRHLSDKQFLLLSCRIAMKNIDILKGARRAIASLTPRHQRDKRVVMQTAQVREKLRVLKEDWASLSISYLDQEFDALVATQIHTTVRLPLQLAVADLYSPAAEGLFNRGASSLTIYPEGSSPLEDGMFNHRVVASCLKPRLRNTAGTFRMLKRLIGRVGKTESGDTEFIEEMLVGNRNAFFSSHYDDLPEPIRVRIEQRVCKDVIGQFRRYFPGFV